MRVAFGADEHCVLTEAALAELLELGQQVLVVADGDPWPDVSRAVALTVAAGDADGGVLCCRQAVEAAAAAGEVEGVRAALCADVEAVREARRIRRANVLALDIATTTPALAHLLLAAFVARD